MASYTAVYAVHKTLSTTVVDTVVLTRYVSSLEVINRSGASALYVTWAPGTGTPADPVAAANDVDVCPSGQTISIDVPVGPVTVKVLGSANDYSIEGRGN